MKPVKINVQLIVLLLFAHTLFAQPAKLDIAVKDLSARGVGISDAEIISERLRSELLATGAFKVMERNDMATVLKEQGFQQSGACDEASCLVEVGQLLGVERIVAGSIGKIASMHTISLRMINVATGEILFSVNEDYQGDLSGVLTTAVGLVARKLAQGVADQGGANVKYAGKTGDLYIATIPAGATVEIDGSIVPGETPLTLKQLPAGEHRIVVHKAEFYGTKTITLAPEDLLKVSIAMDKGRGAIKVFSEPDGAEVLVDGKHLGTAPLKVEALVVGEHQVELVKVGYLPQKSSVDVTIDAVENLSMKLKPAGWLSVSSPNPFVRIMVNGNEVGRGSVQRLLVAAGQVEVTAEAPGFEPYRTTVNLEQNAHEQLSLKLVSVFGSLSVTSQPQGAQVFLNEQQVGTTPYANLRLQPGNYMLRVALDSYEPVQESVGVVKDSGIQRNFQLKHTIAYLDSLEQIKIRAHKRQQLIRRVVFGSLAVASLGSGIAFQMAVLQAHEEQQQIQQEYDNLRGTHDRALFQSYEQQYNQKRNEIANIARKRNISYFLAGAFAAGFAVSIPF